MKEQRLLFLLLWATFSLSAQIKGVVKDSISGEAISYVNIWVENENTGTTSEEDGSFFLDTKEKNNIIFSALGYKIKTINTHDSLIYLIPKVFQLNEVIVENKKNLNLIRVGSFKKGKIKLYYGSGKNPTILAKKIEFSEEVSKHPFLKDINFLSSCRIDKAKIILRFFELDENNMPGSDYLDENIIIEVKKGKNLNKIDLEKYNIKIPKRGIFIAFEWMIINENKYTFTYTVEEENNKIKHKDGLTYQPVIGTIPSENKTWQFNKGKWFKREKHSRDNLKNVNYIDKFGELAIQLTLTN
jgi:hypothetical protein